MWTAWTPSLLKSGKKDEPVTEATWKLMLVKGLPDTYTETKAGVEFNKPSFETVVKLKKS